MARILLSAYACEPGRGSEPGVGWNWAAELASLGHEVTVLTRSANRAATESAACHCPKNLQFLYYDLPAWVQRWRSNSKAKALYYVLWQWFAARHVRQLFPQLPFDLVHHITYVSARYPSFMGSLGIPFWFGPVSGGEAVPPPLRPGFSAGQRCREWLRDASNRLVHLDPLMRLTFHQAHRVFVTRDTLQLLPHRCRNKTAVRLAIGLRDDQLSFLPRPEKRSARDVQILYIGRLLEWKGVDMALRALSLVRQSRPDIKLTVVGDGPARAMLEQMSQRLGLQDAVHWAGWQPQRLLSEFYRAADLLVFPSLRDSGATVVLESLAHGVPVVCTDLGGPGLIVDSTCGRVLSTAGRNRELLSQQMAAALLELLALPDLLASLSYGARVRARQFKFRDLVQSIYTGVPAALTVPPE